MAEQSGYYAVIPQRVLAAQNLSATAKLAYGLIAARLGEEGYCWASNGSIAEALGCSERTVTRCVAELIDAGELLAMDVGATDRHGNRERRLYTRETRSMDRSVAAKASLDKNGEASLDKNGEDYKDYKYSPSNNPLEPPCGGLRVPEPAKWMPERFEAFWSYYRKNVNPANRAAARKAWDKLRPDEETIRQIGMALKARLASDEEWKRGIGLPHASTYLNGQQWLDDGPTARPARRAEDETPMEPLGVWT